MNTQANQANTMRLITPDTLDGVTTVVPAGAELEGTMTAPQHLALRIDGYFKGRIEIASGGALHIGPTAKLDVESVLADHILVEGNVKGNLHARKGMEITACARVRGDTRYEGVIDIHPGAKVNGSICGPASEDDLVEKT